MSDHGARDFVEGLTRYIEQFGQEDELIAGFIATGLALAPAWLESAMSDATGPTAAQMITRYLAASERHNKLLRQFRAKITREHARQSGLTS